MQTNEIMDRLFYYGKNVIRVNHTINNDQKKVLLDFLKKSNVQLSSNLSNINSQIAIYYRRPSRTIIDQLIESDFYEGDVLYPIFEKGSKYFNTLKFNYLSHQKKFYENILSNSKYCICKIEYYLNKIEVLSKARDIGMEIPDTLVSGIKNDVVQFRAKHKGGIITKSLYEIIPRVTDSENFWIKPYTQKVENTCEIPEFFFPSLFQECIEKKFELRVFFMHNVLYSAAILSQQNESTSVDLRNSEKSDKSDKSRIVPYRINCELKSKIIRLMNLLDLNTGSLDFMVGLDDKIYFLEINPVGQFGWINAACNFGISDDIANKMIEIHGN